MCQQLFNGVNTATNHQPLYTLKKIIGPTILLFAGAYMLRLSWLKWPDLLIDYGRELYVPWQITQGKVLYADLIHFYGPLAQYINALLFQIFGTGLSTLVYFNICLVIVLVFLIYDLFKSIFGDFIATVAGLCFLVIFAFSQYVGIANYNFICPYSYELTYGAFLFFLVLFIFKKYLLNPAWPFAALIGFLIGLIYLTKVEIFIASFITFLVGFIFIFWKIRPPHFRKHLFNLIIFFFIPIVAFFIYFSFHMPLINALDSIIVPYKSLFIGTLISNAFYLQISGLNDPLGNVALMFKQACGYVILLIFTIIISYSFTRLKNSFLKVGLLLVIFAIVFVTTFFDILRINWLDAARPYPIFIIALLIFLLVQLILKSGNKTSSLKFLPFALLTLYSLLLLLKMILNVRLYHYGFALAMPASLVMVAILMYYVPAFVSHWGNKTVAAGIMGLFIFLTLLSYFNLTKHIYELKNYPVAEGRDRFLTFDPRKDYRGYIMNITLNYINELMSEKDTFIVLPEGIILNYLTRKSNPTKYISILPPEMQIFGEENILVEFERSNADYIIIVHRNTLEYNANFFGHDQYYGKLIMDWVNLHYTPILLIGNEPLLNNLFGIKVMRWKNI